MSTGVAVRAFFTREEKVSNRIDRRTAKAEKAANRLRAYRARQEAPCQRAVQKTLNGWRDQIINSLETVKEVRIGWRQQEAEKELLQTLQKFYTGTLRNSHEVIQDVLGTSFELPDYVQRAFLKDAGQQITGIADYTRELVQMVLIEANQNGDGIEAVKKALMSNTAFSAGRSRRIARTELGHASNAGAYYTYRASGMVTHIHIFDGEVHPPCAEMNGRVIALELMGSIPTLGHPNCVRAFGPIVGADVIPRDTPLPKPLPPPVEGEFAAVVDFLSDINTGRNVWPFHEFLQRLHKGFAPDIRQTVLDDPSMEKRGAWGAWQPWADRDSGERTVRYSAYISDKLRKLNEKGANYWADPEDNPKAKQLRDGLHTLIHEMHHAKSPMMADWRVWTREPGAFGKQFPWYYFLEEGVTETRSRRDLSKFLDQSGASAKVVDYHRKNGSYQREVDSITWLKDSFGNEIEQRIWDAKSPLARRSVVADEVRPWAEHLLLEAGITPGRAKQFLRTAGDSVWGFAMESHRVDFKRLCWEGDKDGAVALLKSLSSKYKL